jgi:hypothetical protein
VRLLLLTFVAPLLLGLAGCDAAQDAISSVQSEAGDVQQRVEYCADAIRTADAVRQQDWEAAIEHGEALVEKAPDAIRAEAETVLAGARELRDGDLEAANDAEFQAAADELQRYTRETCDPTS